MSSTMACIKCGGRDVKATATTEHPQYNWIRRRRACRSCGHRWWTIELAQDELEVAEGAE